MFTIDQRLLDSARERLKMHTKIYWLIGGSVAGKSTISRVIAGKAEIIRYDMDAHIYDSYTSRYTPERHPANTAWLTAPNPLDWQLSLTPAVFTAFNRAASAEYFDLFAEDMQAHDPQQPLLVDGGITHPALLAEIVPAKRIACLETSRAERVRAWESSEERAMMKQWIFDLPDPQSKWRKFQAFDDLISQTIVAECREHDIALFVRDEHLPVDALARQVAGYFGIAMKFA